MSASTLSRLTQIAEFKDLLDDKGLSLRLFKERLLMKEVPKGQSPLVAAVEKNRPDILRYILNNFNVNIEQEARDEDSQYYPRITPLWLASRRGNLECAKVLVEGGANIEDEFISPLWEALFRGKFEVALYLINHVHRADLEVDQMLFYAIVNEDLTQLLIDKGANVNCTNDDASGNTPLHLTTSLEVAKTLVSAGAKNSLNNSGLSVVLHGTLECHSNALVKYLIEAFQCGPRELYDVYCMQTAMTLQGQYGRPTAKLVTLFMHKAVQVRSSHPDLFSNLPPANRIYDGVQEPATMEECMSIAQNEIWLFYLRSIYWERILGKSHDHTMNAIRDCTKITLIDGNFKKSVQFCGRYLQFALNSTIFYAYAERFLEVVKFVAQMLQNGHVPSMQLFFQYGLKGVEEEDDTYCRASIVTSVLRLIALWIKVADDYITDSTEQEREQARIKKAVQKLIIATEECDTTIINDLLWWDDSDKGLEFSLCKLLTLLLDCGCPLQRRYYVGENGDFPLHLAVQLHRIPGNVAVDCVRTLLECGAHVDAANFQNRTAKEESYIIYPTNREVIYEILKVIESFEANPPTLQCLSARAIVDYKIEYSEYLPIKMAEFVSWHSGEDPFREEEL